MYARKDYQDVVIGIELLNEPVPARLTGNADVAQFYKEGYRKVRSVSDIPVIISDAFEDPSFWNDVLPPGETSNVIVDHHHYQIFSDEQVALSHSEHLKLACTLIEKFARNANHGIIIGEWTGAITDCATALNGYGIGSRYDGSYPGSCQVGSCNTINSIETWSAQMKDDTRRYIEAQLDAFEKYTLGWIFWTFKTEVSAEWDLCGLLDAKIFPQPLTSRKFNSSLPT